MPEVKTATPVVWTVGTNALTRIGSGEAAAPGLMPLGSASELAADPDATLAANSDGRLPTQKAVLAALTAAMGGATPAAATINEYLGGVAEGKYNTVSVARYMGLMKTKAWSATITLTLDGTADGLKTKVVDVSANTTVNFASIHSGIEGEQGMVRLVSSVAGARTIIVATANGITVFLAPGITVPALGALVGDYLEIYYSIFSPTRVRIDRCVAGSA